MQAISFRKGIFFPFRKTLRPDPEASLAPVPQVPTKSWCASEGGRFFLLVHFFFGWGLFFVGTKICKKMDLYENWYQISTKVKEQRLRSWWGYPKIPKHHRERMIWATHLRFFLGKDLIFACFLLSRWRKKEKLDKLPDWMSTKSQEASEHWNAKKCYFLLGIWRFWVDWRLKNLEILKMIKGEKDLGTCTSPTHVHCTSSFIPWRYTEKHLEDAVICSFIPCEPN